MRRRLREIDRRMGWLRQIADAGRERFLNDVGVQAQAERHLQLAIQAAIDVALHILAEATAETPDDYGSAFLALGRAGILDATLAGRLRAAAGLRNVLVHAYLDVDPVQVWDHLSSLDDLERFAAAIVGYLDQI